VENRCGIDLDASIPASGLAVYHCDSMGSNEWQGGSASRHYQCGLLQADGSFDLETNRSMGDERDLFGRVEGIALSHDTRPASVLWDGSDSGLQISNITEPGRIISFVIGQEKMERVAKASSLCGAAIPDNSPLGLEDAVFIEQEGRVKRLVVEVDISHSNISNLRIDLLSPAGRRAVLHNRTGVGKQNIQKSYDSQAKSSLAALLGQSLKGIWTLRITDLASREEGRLNRWGLQATY
jgi:subtilisin-like proprotein convertase family protein